MPWLVSDHMPIIEISLVLLERRLRRLEAEGEEPGSISHIAINDDAASPNYNLVKLSLRHVVDIICITVIADIAFFTCVF